MPDVENLKRNLRFTIQGLLSFRKTVVQWWKDLFPLDAESCQLSFFRFADVN